MVGLPLVHVCSCAYVCPPQAFFIFCGVNNFVCSLLPKCTLNTNASIHTQSTYIEAVVCHSRFLGKCAVTGESESEQSTPAPLMSKALNNIEPYSSAGMEGFENIK